MGIGLTKYKYINTRSNFYFFIGEVCLAACKMEFIIFFLAVNIVMELIVAPISSEI